MDFKSYCNGFGSMTCVVSVEDLGDGRYGKFRIVEGNDAYISTIEHPAPGAAMLVDKFIPNAEYTTYMTRDLNFEDFCYRAAVDKKCLHSYAKPERMPGIWFNMTFLPVAYEEGNLRFCTYTMEVNFEADSKRLSNISADVASAVLETCIKLRSRNDFHDSMADVIKDIRELCDAEHCCILLMDHFERSCSVLCEAFSDDTNLIPMANYLDDKFYSIAETWTNVISGSNCIVAKNEQDMEVVKERSPIWYESLNAAGAKRIVLFPLKFGDELLGYIWAINFDPDKAPKIKETLETTTFILSSEIYNDLLLDRLKILSSKDMLTGVMNRNEMNNLVDKIASFSEKASTSVGVIFTDLNGLKIVNDHQGHVAGDNLLKNAACALEEVFDSNDIYRAGGDEFTVIVMGITEEELEEDVKKIREASDKYEVSFAIGASFESDKKNIRTALRLADERMYEDKKRYYELHPEKKR